jgi:hypothetical protein
MRSLTPFDEIAILRAHLQDLIEPQAGPDLTTGAKPPTRSGATRPGWPIRRLAVQAALPDAS